MGAYDKLGLITCHRCSGTGQFNPEITPAGDCLGCAGTGKARLWRRSGSGRRTETMSTVLEQQRYTDAGWRYF